MTVSPRFLISPRFLALPLMTLAVIFALARASGPHPVAELRAGATKIHRAVNCAKAANAGAAACAVAFRTAGGGIR